MRCLSSRLSLFHSLLISLSFSLLILSLFAGDTMMCLVEGECDIYVNGSRISLPFLAPSLSLLLLSLCRRYDAVSRGG